MVDDEVNKIRYFNPKSNYLKSISKRQEMILQRQEEPVHSSKSSWGKDFIGKLDDLQSPSLNSVLRVPKLIFDTPTFNMVKDKI